MIPLFRRLWRAFWYDELFAARWGRGLLLWAGAVAAQVAASGGFDAAEKWTGERWAIVLGVAALTGAAGLITAGEKNPKTPAGGAA